MYEYCILSKRADDSCVGYMNCLEGKREIRMNDKDVHSADEEHAQASSVKPSNLITCQLYVWGKFVEYSGPTIAPEDFELPDDVKIEPWAPLPSMALLTIQGITLAGPTRLELLRSFAYELCNAPEKAHELTAIRWEVNACNRKGIHKG